MPRRSQKNSPPSVNDYRHNKSARRQNNPPAGLAPIFEPAHERRTEKYQYDPHLDPQLVWAGKAEHLSFEVDVVPLHIHERVSTRAILEAVKKPESQLHLFGNQELTPDQQIEFYKHEVGWANRLILGDSLLVMNSLLVKEGMAGRVQCIYVDPPYGIKYASNMQARIDKRDVKDKDEDLTHEPEQIKAYRDTWKLGIHSWLTYLRDRLLLCRELLSETGSIFVQINDENLHLARCLMDEVFGRENFVAVIAFVKTSGQTTTLLPVISDYLLWYAKDKHNVKSYTLFWEKEKGAGIEAYQYAEYPDGIRKKIEKKGVITENIRIFRLSAITSQGYNAGTHFEWEYLGHKFRPQSNRHWTTTLDGLNRLAHSGRIEISGRSVYFVRYLEDFPFYRITNNWLDVGSISTELLYAVQTNTKVVERCILMTTDPGDLVFDPTCGSGTTAYCAEKWGRRWITCDTSRVALAIARQRLLTARFDYFELHDNERGPAGGFKYETVPHITLESIAKNTEIDVIAEKYQPLIEKALAELNTTLNKNWQEWEVPREPDTGWSKTAKEAHNRFWELKRAKRREIDAIIQQNAPRETLYDRPIVKRNVVRVSGPFTVEAIPPPAVQIPEATPVPQFETALAEGRIENRAGDYLLTMIDLLKQQGGVVFPGGKRLELRNIRPLNLSILHAEAETGGDGEPKRVAISFGPQFGPVTAYQIQEAIQPAKWNKFDILLVAGFAFEPEVHSYVQRAQEAVKGLMIHCVNIAPDVLSGDLLKTTRASQIFTVFGEPDIGIEKQKDGTCVVELRGVDIYDPLKGEVHSSSGSDVAAWFLDTDYDGMTFHICQAFFPGDPDAWDKLQRALRAQIEPAVFEQMRGTRSFPFKPGSHSRIAVKVIDFRGQEVMRVMEIKNFLTNGRKSG
ncbi:MAG: site-specific DNA-methyltransferase [candidate division WOR-3 bacterium]